MCIRDRDMTMKLYKYSGTIEEFAVERGRISYIKLFDVPDFDKAPTLSLIHIYGQCTVFARLVFS